jgi:hypothetical protein
MLIQLDAFVEEMLIGCEEWLASVKGTDPFEKNYGRFATRHTRGLQPYVLGAPVIG